MYESLESNLNAKEFISNLESKFDEKNYSTNKEPLRLLRNIKVFMYREWDNWRPLSKNTKLDSTDCLTLATIAYMLAYRKGVETNIVRPKQLNRYFHAMLSCENKLFKLTGRPRKYECVDMTSEQIQRRIKYTRPIINFVNSLRGINSI